MDLSAQEKNGILVISVNEPRIDSAGAIQFKDKVREFHPEGFERVILNLKGVTFVDSSGLGAIVSLMKHLAPVTRLELSGLEDMVKKVFALTRMDQVFKIHNSVEEGLRGTEH